MIETIIWDDRNNVLKLLDQRLLPGQEVYTTCRKYEEAAEAIANLTVRGAPLIGVTAAFGFALGAITSQTTTRDAFVAACEVIGKDIAATRPTARNLFWAIEQMMAVIRRHPEATVAELKELLLREAQSILADDHERNNLIGKWGAELFSDGDRVLTHCNAGALATAGPYGTALSPVRYAIGQGKKLSVYADETRPVLQGARLTAWECLHDNIPVTLLCDNAAGSIMARGMIDKIIVGADRIAANGDVVNKIGTYSVAVLAQYHGIPFYVAAPLSTFDFSLKSGLEIPIEQRDDHEVTTIGTTRIAPHNITVINNAFDVTPAALITALISERGIARPPYQDSLAPWRS